MLLAMEKKKVKDFESAAAVREEFARAKDAEVRVLRKELRDMERTWSAQLADASDRVSEQIGALQRQTEGQKALRAQYLVKVKDCVTLQVRLDSETRKALKCETELKESIVERDKAKDEAEQIRKWAEPLSVQLKREEDLVKALEAKASDLERRLEHEKASCDASKREAHGVKWKIESARCQLADMYAKSSREIKKLAQVSSEATEKGMMLEAQLKDANDLVRMRTQEAESAKAFKKAARQQLEVVLGDFRKLEEKSAINQVDAVRAKEDLTKVVVERDKLRDELATCSSDLISMRFENKERGERLDELSNFERNFKQNKVKMTELESMVGSLTEEKERLEGEAVELKKEIERLLVKELELENLTLDHSKLKERHKGLAYEHDIASQSVSVLNSRIGGLEQQIDNMKDLSDQKGKILEDERKQHAETRQLLKAEKEKVAVLTQKERSATLAGERSRKAEAEARDKAVLLEASESLARSELSAARRDAEDAERMMKEALIDRDWCMMMRGLATSDLQALTLRSERDLEQIMDRASQVKESLIKMQGLMTNLKPYTPITLPLPFSLDHDDQRPEAPSTAADDQLMTMVLEGMDSAATKEVFDHLNALLLSLDSLIQTERENCLDLARKVRGIDGQARESRKKASSEFWTTCLAAAKVDTLFTNIPPCLSWSHSNSTDYSSIFRLIH